MTKKTTEKITEKKATAKTEATVAYRGQTRTYTKEVHGDDFAKLAKQFAEKMGGEIV